VAALLFDLDRFKSINDRFGHAVGDQVLQVFADIAASELRSTDLLGRLGGEEFGALLFGADAGSAAATAERIRRMFAATYPGGTDSTSVSVSIGLAAVPAGETVEVETLLSRADEALYVAKARGRNRVEVAGAYAGPARTVDAERDLLKTKIRDEAQTVADALDSVASPKLAPKSTGAADSQRIRPAIQMHG
jgi:diguanylate cyclase (GGDEF)-like protein